jgi:ferredoxin-NADP reductase
MLVGLSAGRTDTNGGTLKTDQNTAVKELDQEFTKARDERNQTVKSNFPLKVKVKRSVCMGSEAKQITLDVRDKLFKIWPGDKLSILPRNSNDEVNTFLNLIGGFIVKDTKTNYSLNINWRKFIDQQGLEINTSDDFLRVLLTYGDLENVELGDIDQFFKKFKINLLGFSAPWLKKQNIKFWLEIIGKENRHIKSSEFLDWLLNSVAPMNYRFYSICTSPKELDDSGEIGLTVGLLKYDDRIGKCSFYLHSLKEGDFVEMRPVYAYWNLPEKKETPIICIAGGSGISPMLALLKHRFDMNNCFENNLFFVTKNLENFYFQNDLEKFVREKNLKFFGSFTRDSDECSLIKKSNKNIVSLLNDQRDLINMLLRKDASIYVCGRVEFAKKVSKTLEKILEDSFEKEKIPQKIINMKHQGKYIEEAFTSHVSTTDSNSICISDILSNDNYFVMGKNVYDVSEFKRIHPGGDFVFLVSSENDYNQVHGNDLIAKNMLDSLRIGQIKNMDKFDQKDLEDLKKLKNLIGKYYCATDVPAESRTKSILIEHQNAFVKNFQSYFKDSHLVGLKLISNHDQFTDSAELIKVLTNHMPQDFIAFLWENVEKFNFRFLFSLRNHLINALKSEKSIKFDFYQNPYEEFTKYIIGFKKVTPSNLRHSIKTIQNKAFSRLNSQLSPLSDADSFVSPLDEKQEIENSLEREVLPQSKENLSKASGLTQPSSGISFLRKLKLKYT